MYSVCAGRLSRSSPKQPFLALTEDAAELGSIASAPSGGGGGGGGG
jgi:hypothetical protein